jgi:plasmid stability protein
MFTTCTHAIHMKAADSHVVMIQVRHVPDAIHRKLKARAATAGMSLSDYVLAELRRLAERPSREELLARIASRPIASVGKRAAELIRAERDRR